MIQKIKRLRKSDSQQGIFFSVLLGLLVVTVVGFFIFSNLKINQRRAELTARIESLKEEIQVLEKKNIELQAGISQSTKESQLEKEAREKLGLKKSGEEVVVVLPPEESEEETKEEKSFWQKFLEKIGF